ncbi:hypothetical protein G9A89_020171 [Geosiphon pyriformis]|nr:hypothetical protein G9A89_020171 [Geosiphon pyriformis]
MDSVGASAGSFGTGLAGLKTQSSGKKKAYVNSMYFCSLLFKKLKMSVVSDMIDLFINSLNLKDIGGAVGSVSSSVSSFLDVENMENIIAEETSYTESGEDDNMNEAMLKKTHMIIRSSFISKSSLKKAKKLAINENILINNNVKQINKCSNQEIVVKEIFVNLLKSAVKSVFSKFGRIVSIKMQLVGLWQKADLTLLYTLPIGTTVHDLSDLLILYNRKICLIGHNLSLYVHDRCAIVCFADETSKLAVIGSILVFKSVNLCWISLFLVCCTLCKQFGHILSDCFLSGNSGVHGKQMVTTQDQICLANIYKKKQAPIVYPVFFGDKTWAQVAEIRIEHLIEDSLPGGIPAIKLRKKLTKLQFQEPMNKTITIESLYKLFRHKPSDHYQLQLDLSTKLWKTSTNTNLKVTESENIGANHLGFAKFLFQHYCQHLRLNHNHISAESAFNFYVNERIAYLLETPVNIKLAREAFYSELIQNTNLPTNHNFASIIMEINKKIEHHTQQKYPITYASKDKGKLQTPAVTPKRIQPSTWKKTRVESSTNPLYHYTPGSAINITSTGAATSNMTSAFE